MIIGYPTTDADLDAMYEADLAKDWEEQNREPEINRFGIYNQLGYAWDALSEAVSNLAEAASLAEGHPYADRIASFQADVEDVQRDLQKIRDRLMQEVRSA